MDIKTKMWIQASMALGDQAASFLQTPSIHLSDRAPMEVLSDPGGFDAVMKEVRCEAARARIYGTNKVEAEPAMLSPPPI